MSLAEAKAAAKGMMRGMPGEYTVTDPIGHLNGLAARLLDKSGAPSSLSGPVANRDSEMPSLLSQSAWRALHPLGDGANWSFALRVFL